MSRRNNIIIAGVTLVAFILFLIFIYQPYAKKQEGKSKFTDSIQKSYILRDPVQQIPEFALTDQNGNTYGSNDLKGKVFVADFIYTSCESSCPVISSELTTIEKSINKSEPFRMVSFSLDPAHDSVPALKAFSKQFGAIDSIWHFLTGPREQIYDLGQKGFLQTVLNKDQSFVQHSQKVVLVDKSGMIRGFYNGVDSIEMSLLVRDINYLLFNDPTHE